jgi:molybdenum cofactor cytidylyltransferase
MMEVAGLLLAAGSARRFGSPKLLHPLPDGVPVGVASARALVQAVPNVLVVVQPDDRSLIETFLSMKLKVVENPCADHGIGASLSAGVSASGEAGGWLIALADMPWIHPATIRMLADRLRSGASMVAPVNGGRRGHPVGFSRRWGDKLRTLGGDDGARSLLTEHADELVLLDTADRGVLQDIDRPEDLIRDSRGSIPGPGKAGRYRS